jgi:hypothetical protein
MAARRDNEQGQASIELVAAVPVVLLVAAVVWQLALVGEAAWLAANAARAGARADAVGEDPAAAVRSALPAALEGGLQVDRLQPGGVRVSLRVPLLLQPWEGPVRVAAASSLGRRQ